jgi:hypothetical protein
VFSEFLQVRSPCRLSVELKNTLKYKKELLNNLKNLIYHHSDDIYLLTKQLEDANKQLLECMQQIRSMAEEKELRQKQLEDLKGATRVIVDMVDPPEEGVVDNRTMLECLHVAPQKISATFRKRPRCTWRTFLGLSSHFGPRVT